MGVEKMGDGYPKKVSAANVNGGAEGTVAINVNQDWHSLTFEEVAAHFRTDIRKGLTEDDVAERLKEYGPNELFGSSGPSILKVLIANTFNAMNGVLAVAMILSIVVRDWAEAAVLAVVILTNTGIGFAQEYRSERTMDALRHMASPTARVIRNREIEIIQSRDVVPGDIITLEEGDIVPADIRLFEAVNLETDEALLTGESIPVAKRTDPIHPNPETTMSNPDQPSAASLIPLGDRKNLAYSSTLVAKGRGMGICISTGLKTEVGKIAAAVSDGPLQHSATPAQRVKELLKRQKAVRKQFMARLIRRQKKHLDQTQGHPDNTNGDQEPQQPVAPAPPSSLVSTSTKTPLQRTLSRMMFFCLGVACILAVVVFGANKWSLSDQVLLYAIGVAVAILPEGLPAVVTVTMAVGVRNMAKQKAIVRRLAALEALGQVTNVCSDKTGTLTEGKMVVKNAWVGCEDYTVTGKGLEPIGDLIREASSTTEKEIPEVKIDPAKVEDYPILHRALLICSLCATSTLFYDDEESRWKATGDPTEIALQVLGAKLSLWKDSILESTFSFHAEFPFDSFLKRMTVVFLRKSLEENSKEGGGGKVEVLEFLMKGALERVLECCDSFYDKEGKAVPLTDEFQNEAQSKMLSLAGKGMRVLALAHRRLEREPIQPAATSSSAATSTPTMPRREAEQNLTFVGLIAMYDPPRIESAPSVAMCRKAGIVVHMATGDHPKTAEAIARECGILSSNPSSTGSAGDSNLVLTAAEFDFMTDAEVDKLPELPRVLARCAPETKVRLVKALHRRRKFVAMTGDGVNDAPAVKGADIGIAMGLGGSDVTKQASSITLTDDNFHTILVAIREGRRLFANSTRIALHLLSGNVAEVVALIIGLSIRDINNDAVFPMSPIQILWLNMVTSSPVALALGMEFASPDIMDVPPRSKDSSLWTPELITDTFFYGVTMGILSLGSFLVTIVTDTGNVMTGLSGIPSGCNKDLFKNPDCRPIFVGRAVGFYTLCILLLVHGFNCRHLRLSTFHRGQLQNKYLWMATILGVILVVPTAYIGDAAVVVFAQTTFGWQWGIIGINVVFFLGISELYKAGKRSFYGRRERAERLREGVGAQLDLSVEVRSEGNGNGNAGVPVSVVVDGSS